MARENEGGKFAYLDRLSTQRLEELLRADMESDQGHSEVIFHILEVMEQREREHPTGRLANPEEAWTEFQAHYNLPEGEGRCLYPTGDEEAAACVPSLKKKSRLRPFFRAAGMAAASAVLLLGTMVCVQATGIDVFGTISRWTADTFRFVSVPDGASPNSPEYQTLLREALHECGIPQELAPSWYPDGAEPPEIDISSDMFSSTVHCDFGRGEDFFSIDITSYSPLSEVDGYVFEKDSSLMEEYTIDDGKTFYILSNLDTVTATWAEGNLVETIWGNLTLDEVKNIINSIGGQST